MRTVRLVVIEIAHHLRVFWRVPVAGFFTVGFPAMVYVLLAVFNVGESFDLFAGVDVAGYLTPAIGSFALVTSAFTNVAITVSADRDDGILKRIRGTPLPPWVFMTGRIGAAVLTGLGSVVLLVAVGALFFDVAVPWERIPVVLAVLLVGAAAFAALGLAVVGAAPNAQAAPAVANGVIIPLAFVSGVFFPVETAPAWIAQVAGLLPLRPLVVAVAEQWNPAVDPGIPAAELGILGAWLAVGVLVTARTFTWEPRPGGGSRRRRTAEL